MAEDGPTEMVSASDVKVLLLMSSPVVFFRLFFSSFHPGLPDDPSSEPHESQADRCSSYVSAKKRFFFKLHLCVGVAQL